ncbi:hypothetical protein K7472_22210 [Streptomyces sp. PTM05]|uniref:N-acetyltransferase domain-containing protein n=1 Tax=Streptantibioticus parmotrematis TaxID=2873249 RepID=A0ABS7QWD8_9ACTN|nr:hypothetical protein [Streptantibioticus parmotrematis]MBY8887533.1 hypothetical protein [Streptantibioticus parmotrematis]
MNSPSSARTSRNASTSKTSGTSETSGTSGTSQASSASQGEPVSEAFLRGARAAGLLTASVLGDCVADLTEEPFTGERQLLVEYASPRLLADAPAFARTVRALVADRGLPVDRVVVRVPGGLTMPEPWAPYLTYLRWTGEGDAAAGQEAGTDGVTIATAGEADDPVVVGWLVRAFRAAGTARGSAVDEGAALDQARAVLDQPDRVTLMAWSEGRPVGHATLLTEAVDDVSGLRFVELLDVLVEPSDRARAVSARLVAAATSVATREGHTLVGNVVHGLPPDPRSAQVVAGLEAHGWRTSHRYWSAPQGDEGSRT